MDSYGQYSQQTGRTNADSAYPQHGRNRVQPSPEVMKKLFPVARSSRGKRRPRRKSGKTTPQVIRLLGATRVE